jgi:hypothetical protein
MQNDIEQGFVNTDTSVVLDKAQLAKPIHEEAHTRPGGSDHLRQRLLRDPWDQGFWFSGLAEFCHEQQDSRQPLLAVIKKLIDKIGLPTTFPTLR